MKSIFKIVALLALITTPFTAADATLAAIPVAVDVLTSCKSTVGVLVVWSDGRQDIITEAPLTPEQEDLLNRVPKEHLYFLNVTPPGGCPIRV